MGKVRLITTLLFASLVLSNCNESTNDKKIPLSKKQDTLKLVEIFSFHDVKNSSLFLVRDSAIFLPEDTQSYFLGSLYYDSANNKFRNTSIHKSTPYRRSSTNPGESAHPGIEIKSIGNPMIKYARLPEELKIQAPIKEILKSETRIHLFNGEYFFIDRIMPQKIYWYNVAQKKLNSFDIKEKYFEITDFLLYDLDKDDKPEIFLFHIGTVPREDVISYTIYSLRYDSITVSYN